MRPSPHLNDLHSAIERLVAAQPDGPICIGYSGGMDSTVLLACASRSAAVRARGLSAIHVHHGLHADADNWAAQAQSTADALAVPLTTERVRVESRGQGLEAAARAARYSAFATHVASGWLLLAHHQDDQAETVLLRLLRGAALDGVAAMRPQRAFGAAWLGRPWLDQPRSRLLGCAQQLGLRWIEDPSNRDPRHDRVFLRRTLWPLLEQRFPAAGERLARFAQHAQGVQAELDALTGADLASLRNPQRATLSISGLLALSEARFGACVRRFALDLGAPAPGFHELARLRREVLGAAIDANPCLRWQAFEFRRYRDELYLLPEEATRPGPELDIAWAAGAASCALPKGLGTLASVNGAGVETPVPCGMTVSFRRAGERLRPVGHAHHRELRLLFQELAVPTWERARMPLLFAGKTLVAAVGLASSDEFAALWPGLRVVWRPK